MNFLSKVFSCFLLVFIACSYANASVSATLQESDGNLVYTFSGSLNLDVLHQQYQGYTSAEFGYFSLNSSGMGAVSPGGDSVAMYVYRAYVRNSADKPSGVAGIKNADSTSGDLLAFVVDGTTVTMYLSRTYSSGNNILGSNTYNGVTLEDWGLTAGVYSWDFSYDEGTTDTYTLTIGDPSSVPEPSAVALGLGAGAGLLAFARRRKQR